MRVILAIIVLALLIYIALKIVADNIKVDINFKKLDLLKLLVPIAEGKQLVQIQLQVNISNNNRFSIPVRNLRIFVYHNDQLVAISEKSVNITIKRRQVDSFTHTLNILLNEQFFEAVKQLKFGQKIKLDYKAKGSILGVPLTFEDNFEFIKP